MAQYKPGEIVPQSGVFTLPRDPVHVDVPHEMTVIKGSPLSDLSVLPGGALPARPRSQARLRNRAFRRGTGAGFIIAPGNGHS